MKVTKQENSVSLLGTTLLFPQRKIAKNRGNMIMNYTSVGILLKDYFDGLKRFAEFVPDMINLISSSCHSLGLLAFSYGLGSVNSP